MKRLLQRVINRDVQLFYLFNHKLKCRLLDLIMPRITHLGGALFTCSLTILLVLFGQGRLKQTGWQVLIALVSSGVVVQIIKTLVDRNRPYKVLKEVNIINPPFCMRSFPSGHTTAIFSVAIVFGINFPSLSLLFRMIAGLVGFSRAYIGVHYPSDILTGALIGIYFSNWAHGLI
ncbi:phosphatase PAP2 family protein [Natroniella sp. ANB-PHB2]|uniref:phosphatase PAP2 family protein n=1 Tax=Natroniella sp. ANB-PHB2 TaxID=3384444 RepID=UPI0038D490FB